MPYTPGAPTRSRLQAGLTVTRGTLLIAAPFALGTRANSIALALQDLLATISQQCRASSLWGDKMRALILAVVGGLALAASAQAAPLTPKALDPATYLLDQEWAPLSNHLPSLVPVQKL